MRLCLILIGMCCFTSLYSNVFDEAMIAYKQGEEAETIEERSKCFNKALKLYTANETEDGKLYYNIANCYYQLDQLGMAIWYYTKAERLMPRESNIKENLSNARKVAQVPTSSWEAISRTIFFFHYKLTPNEKSLFFILFSALSFGVASLFIWFRKPFLKPFIVIFVFSNILFGMSLVQTNRISKEGLFIEPVLLRCDAGMQYKEMDEELLGVGQKFKILEISEDQEWVKIKTAYNKKGYVLAKHTRLF